MMQSHCIDTLTASSRVSTSASVALAALLDVSDSGIYTLFRMVESKIVYRNSNFRSRKHEQLNNVSILISSECITVIAYFNPRPHSTFQLIIIIMMFITEQ